MGGDSSEASQQPHCRWAYGVMPEEQREAEEGYAILPHRLPHLVRTAGISYRFFMYLLSAKNLSAHLTNQALHLFEAQK